MKTILLYTLISVFLLYGFSGCTKPGNSNNTQYVNDQHAKYLGTWKGLATDTSKKSADTMTLVIFRVSDTSKLQGYVTFRNIVYKINENAFFGGINYSVINYNSQCQEYSLFLNTVTENATTILVNFIGDYCDGSQLNVTGNIPQISPTVDLSKFLTFAKTGHSWTWLVTNYNSTTCSYTYSMVKDYQNGAYKFTQSNTCNWPNTSNIGWWYVSPQEWASMTDSLPVDRVTNFRTDAVIGTVYKKMFAQDSVINTVESLNDNIIVNGQQYYCARIRTKQWHSGTLIIHGLVWINNQYGLVKFANQITTGPLANVQFEELQSKNF